MSKKTSKSKHTLRSTKWFGRHDRDGLVHRSWMKNQGIPHDQFDGRPVIGICNTWSQATPCNAHFRELAQHVRDGILDAGGFPIEFPVMSLGETLMRPTPMLNGKFRGEDIGSGTHVWKFTEMLKTGAMNEGDMIEAESCMSRSAGHCMTMGTASTMASMVEALGMGLPTNAAIPAVDSHRFVLAHMVGRRIVEMVKEDLRMS